MTKKAMITEIVSVTNYPENSKKDYIELGMRKSKETIESYYKFFVDEDKSNKSATFITNLLYFVR